MSSGLLASFSNDLWLQRARKMENVWKLPPAVREGIQLARSGSGGTINACDSDRGQSSEKKNGSFLSMHGCKLKM